MPGATNGLLVVLLGGLCLALAVSVRRRDVAAAVNVLASLAAVAVSLPLAIGVPLSGDGTVLAPALPLWIVTAGLLHSIGMLGPYESVWWWDHLTHTVSAALVAALSYAGVTVAADAGAIPPLSTAAVAAATIGFTLAAGVFWELVELVARALGERYDVEPVLVHYGWRDTGLDLVFDFVGAVVVVLLDVRVFIEPAARVPELTGAVLFWSTGVILGGSVLLALALAVTVDRPPSEW